MFAAIRSATTLYRWKERKTQLLAIISRQNENEKGEMCVVATMKRCSRKIAIGTLSDTCVSPSNFSIYIERVQYWFTSGRFD